ncbi:MAG: RsmD family RNA methyltransferase [Ignavibacteriae bacterium]|nr:RsmD family RNA methyltransferase [Ignavibacteriota bacterium]
MRIISGIYKGRTLKSPSSKIDIRPTTDRARETLFNILSNKIDFENKICLDLFCGTGSFGLEFISRGGRECTFVDFDTRVIKENVSLLNLNGNFNIIRSDAVKYLSSNKKNKFDIAFADPPYKYGYYGNLLEEISIFKLVFILEHGKNFVVTDDFKNKLFLQKKIGISLFSFFDFN